MLKLAVIVLLVYCPATWAKTCTECKTAYGTPGAGEKCEKLKTYLTCLEGSAKGEAGCPLPTDDAAVIQTDFTDSCKFTDTCICQKDFWQTDQSATGEADTCRAIQTYTTCLKGKTALACNGTTNVTILATAVETRIKALPILQPVPSPPPASVRLMPRKQTSPLMPRSAQALKAAAATSITSTKSCTVTTACQCELDAAKADISTVAKKCTVLTTLKTCLSAITTTTETGCTSITQADLVADTDTKITAAKCGSFADHVTYTMTSLIVPVFVQLFM